MKDENSALLLRRSVDDPEAFTGFYRLYFEPILAYLARRLRDEEVALDLTAESFAQAYAGRSRFRGSERAQAEAWIFQIAKRQMSRYLRRGKLERSALQKLGIEVPELDEARRERIEELAGLEGFRVVVRQELSRLSDAQQKALQLRVLEELSYSDVAKRLRISEQAARLRVSRGLRTMALALESNPQAKEV